MFSLAILLLVLAIFAVSLNVPQVILSAASISGVLLAACLIGLIASRIVSVFPRHRAR